MEILQARILEWVAFLFFRGSSQFRDRTQVSYIAGRFFTSWATTETHEREVYNNYKWSIVFKNCESLYCTPVTYNIVQQLCGAVVKNLPTNSGDRGDTGSSPGSGRRRRKWQPTPVFLSGKSHGQRSLVDYSPWGHKELDTTEYACMHTSI